MDIVELSEPKTFTQLPSDLTSFLRCYWRKGAIINAKRSPSPFTMGATCKYLSSLPACLHTWNRLKAHLLCSSPIEKTFAVEIPYVPLKAFLWDFSCHTVPQSYDKRTVSLEWGLNGHALRYRSSQEHVHVTAKLSAGFNATAMLETPTGGKSAWLTTSQATPPSNLSVPCCSHR